MTESTGLPKAKTLTVDELCSRLRKVSAQGPYFDALIGAGCSVTGGVPLANQMVQEVLAFHPYLRNRIDKGESLSYAQVMSWLPPADRQQIIEKATSKAKVNLAHLCLANLMQASILGTLFSANFDDLFVRASFLMGNSHLVFDLTLGQYGFSTIIDKASVYLHGTLISLRQVHTESDAVAHLERLQNVFATQEMARPLIVSGYSGINDNLLDSLLGHHQSRRGIYWIGYREVEERVLRFIFETEGAFLVRNIDADSFWQVVSGSFGVATILPDTNPIAFMDQVQSQIESDSVAPNVRQAVNCGSTMMFDAAMPRPLSRGQFSDAYMALRQAVELADGVAVGKLLDEVVPALSRYAYNWTIGATKLIADDLEAKIGEIRHIDDPAMRRARGARVLHDLAPLIGSAFVSGEFLSAYASLQHFQAEIEPDKSKSLQLLVEAAQTLGTANYFAKDRFTYNLRMSNIYLAIGQKLGREGQTFLESSLRLCDDAARDWQATHPNANEESNVRLAQVLVNRACILLVIADSSGVAPADELRTILDAFERADSVSPGMASANIVILLSRLMQMNEAIPPSKRFPSEKADPYEERIKKTMERAIATNRFTHADFVRSNKDLKYLQKFDWFRDLLDKFQSLP